jgi:Tol biopolymer transport system component
LISVDSAGVGGGDGHTGVGRATPDGRYVVFESAARNLVSGVDTNYSSDVFVRDVAAGSTRLVSVNREGNEPGLGGSVDPWITPDGRWVAFASTAEDLVVGDTNGLADVFVRDLVEDTTEWISAGSASPISDPGYFYGSAGPRITADGRWVIFSSTATNMVAGVTNLHGEIYLRDRVEGTTICPSSMVHDQVPLPNGATVARRRAFSPSIGEDGRYLAFMTEATLGPPAANQLVRSLWRFEVASGEATLVTTNITLGTFVEQTAYTMSPDGRWLAYLTPTLDYRNDVVLWDGQTGNTILATPAFEGGAGTDGFCDMPELSADGRFLVFISSAGNLVTNDTGGTFNVFVRDIQAGRTELVSVDAAEAGLGGADLAFPGISHDGAWVMFDSNQPGYVPGDKNLAYDVFMRQREMGVTELVSRADPAAQSRSGNGHSSLGFSPFSEDGGRLVFRSESDELAPGVPPGQGQVYVHDVASETNALVSVNRDGDGAANAWCYEQVISGNGHSVAFTSAADNLTAGDTNDRQDVFVRDLELGSTTLISRTAQSPVSGNDTSGYPAINHDGNRVGFLSYATDLVASAAGSALLRGYLHDRQGQETFRVSDPLLTSVSRTTPRLSPNGRYLAYANERWPFDAWLYDHDTRQGAELVSGPAAAVLIGEYFSRDGRYLVAWGLDNPIAPNGFLLRHDLTTGTREQFSLGPATSAAIADIAIDHSARFIAFSTILGLVALDTNQLTDVYLFDFDSTTLTLLSLNREGTAAGRAASRSPSISGDGRLVTFSSDADDLVEGDTNGTADVFLFDRLSGALVLASLDPDGNAGNHRSGNPHLSPIGHHLAFTSAASNFIPGDRNGMNDVFLTTVHLIQAVDTDGDGMEDNWESDFFGGLEAQPDEDADADGFTNLEEYIAGTDPRDPHSRLRLEITTAEPGRPQLRWTAAPGRVYQIVSTPDLAGQPWSATPGSLRIAGGSASFEPAEPAPTGGFYRLLVFYESLP